ncbi:MAG: ribosomal protein S18-alanine N-acetyltransferase [Desulfobacterales bacterium]|nr:ribosomal protein S18-alanine N-acetyltransferase [Desulfobacterales bacterium]
MAAPTFTPATPADLEGLLELERRCFAEPWGLESVARELAAGGGAGIVLREPAAAGRPVAFLFYRLVDTEAELFRVAVAPELRRRGIGGALVAEFLRQARGRGMRSAVLEVGAANAAALALYRAAGFETAGVRRGYYAGGREDAVILKLELRSDSPDSDCCPNPDPIEQEDP